MKTKYMISAVLKTFIFVALAFGIANCAKSNNNGNISMANGYRLVNNICYQSMNGVSMPASSPTACSQVNAPIYQMTNGICYQMINGQPVQQPNQAACSTTGAGYGAYGNCAPQLVNGQYVQQPYCNQGSTYPGYGLTGGAGAGVVTQVCMGPYTDGNQWVNCGTQMNCSGYTLYNQSMQFVRCQ